jgi:copper transport protein
MRRALVLATLVALAAPASAFAHATLKESTPKFEQRVETPPPEVRLHFDQGVKALPNAIQVFAASGRLVSLSAGGSGHDLTARLPTLPKGAYTVRWHALSSDGHVVSGVYTFGVRMPAPPPTEAVGAQGPTRTEHVVRWAYFLSLALLVGVLGFRLLVLRGPLPKRLEKRFYALELLGAVAVLEVGVVAFILRAEDALQLPFSRLLYGDLSPIASGTRFGRAFIAMTLGFSIVTALLFLAWVTDRVALLWTAFLLGLALASGLSLSGHSAADYGASKWSELADWVHLSAAMLWVGGLVAMAAAVWPAAPELRRRAFLGFARLAPVLIALLLTAGTYLSILRLPHVSDLWTQGYGQVLLVKLGLVATALAWGAAHHFLVAPRLERGESGEPVARLRRSLLGESAVAVSILLAAAILVDSKPPPRPTPQPVQAARSHLR